MAPQGGAGTAEGDQDVFMGVGLVPDLDSLEEDLEDGDLRVEADVEANEDGGMFGMMGGAGGGAARGGMMGGMLGSLAKLVSVGVAIVGLLLLLEPIQAALGGILRILELAVVPLVAALTPLINSVMELVTSALKFFRDPTSGIESVLKSVVQNLGNAIISGLNQIPGVNISPLNLTQDSAAGSGIQGSGGEMTSNTHDSAESAFKSYMMGPFGEGGITPLWEVLGHTDLLSDEASKEKLQDNSSGSPDDSFSSGGMNP